jgi:hypothetical protein
METLTETPTEKKNPATPKEGIPLPSAQIGKTPDKYTPFSCRFVANGKTYVYEYGRCAIIQIQRAETVFRYREEMEENPPITLELLESSSGGEYLIEAMRHLLLEETADGNLVPYNKDNRGFSTREWLEDAPADMWGMLREARLDFFTITRLRNVELSNAFLRSERHKVDAAELVERINLIDESIRMRAQRSKDYTKEANLKEDLPN